MELKSDSKTTITLTKKQLLITKILFPVFAFFVFLFTIFLSGGNPFGQISPLDAITLNINGSVQEVAPNTASIVQALSDKNENLETNLDRCLVMDPNADAPYKVGDVQAAASNQVLPAGKSSGGINNGDEVGGYQNAVQVAQETGASYVLALATQPDQTQQSVNFVNDSLDAGLIPILRLCYPGNCGFNSPETIETFFRTVNSGAQGEFIAMVGPNEPGTAEEMEAFIGIFDYPRLADFINDSATRLQDIRGNNLLLAPGAFNITNTQANDGAELEGPLDESLFDVLLANTYDLPGGSAYTYYESNGRFSMKSYAEESGLPVILTEFGSFTGDKNQLTTSIKEFCGDPSIVGVMLFRSFDEGLGLGSATPSPDTKLSANEIIDLFNNCPTDGIVQASSSYSDYSWLNCNLDSCYYEDNYSLNAETKDEFDRNSTAGPAVVDTDTSPGTAAVVVSCSVEGETDGQCFINYQETVDVSLPIKQFGSNSIIGSPSYQFPPICVDLALRVDPGAGFNALNQFAGRLTSESGSYPMPWLGNAINCSAELIQSEAVFDIAEFSEDPYELYPFLSPGSTIEEELREIENEKERLQSTYFSTEGKDLFGSELNFSLEEQVLCETIDGKEYCGTVGNNTDYYQSRYQNYNPLLQAPNYASSSDANFLYREEPDNYITGPEVVLNEEKLETKNADFSGITGRSLCVKFAQRNSPFFSTSFPFAEGVSEYESTCRYLADVNISPVCQPTYCDAERAQAGTCYFPSNGDPAAGATVDACFQYNEDDPAYYELEIEDHVPPEYDIAGAYDSLYWMYSRMQNSLSSRGLKLVVRENLGWKSEVSAKIRDLNRGSEFESIPYYYSSGNYSGEDSQFAVTSTTDDEGAITATAASLTCTEPELISNNSTLARGSGAINTSNQYYEWLGYLDLLQEWQTTYLYSDDSVGAKINSTESVFTDAAEDFPADASNFRDVFVTTNISELASSSPFYSCDEIEVLKLTGDLPEDVDLNCITDIGDTRYDDALADFLSCKGYDIVGECKPSSIQDNQQNACFEVYADSDEDVEFDTEFNPIYPVAQPVVTSTYGPRGTRNHAGVDFNASVGTEVFSIEKGEVIFAGPDIGLGNKASYELSTSDSTAERGTKVGAYGRVVKVRHPNGFISLYAHLSRVDVSVGDQITIKTRIGLSGNEGNSTGPHLHLEIRNERDAWDGNLNYVVVGTNEEDGSIQYDGPYTDDPLIYLEGRADQIIPGGIVCDPDIEDGNFGKGEDFGELNCLIAAVTEYIDQSTYIDAGGFLDLTVMEYPPELLKATLRVETALTDDDGSPYSGDVKQQAYVEPNGAGAAGPTQFTSGTWNSLINTHGEALRECFNYIGFEVDQIELIHRTYLGPALCATAIEHSQRTYRILTYTREKFDEPVLNGFSDYNADGYLEADEWFEAIYPSQYANDGDRVSYDISPIHIAARTYYGGCTWDFGNGLAGDYCEDIFEYSKEFRGNMQCNLVPESNDTDTL